jgi:hypothetical protein
VKVEPPTDALVDEQHALVTGMVAGALMSRPDHFAGIEPQVDPDGNYTRVVRFVVGGRHFRLIVEPA